MSFETKKIICNFAKVVRIFTHLCIFSRLATTLICVALLCGVSSCMENQQKKVLENAANRLQVHINGDTPLLPNAHALECYKQLSNLVPNVDEPHILYLLDASCSVCIADYLFSSKCCHT